MAKKKTPAQDLPLEEQPLFLKTLEHLPAESEALEQLAGQMLELFNDAMRAGSLRDIETSALRYEAVVYRLNGDTFFGSGADDGPGTRLKKRFAAPAGTVPGWGQVGEYLLEVAGMLLRVKVDPWRGFNGVHSLGFYAVDAAAPFISETGFMSHFMHADKHVGQELGQAVRADVEHLLQGERKPRPISEKDRAKVSIPAWLAPALQSVTRNGQLAMPLAGDALSLAAPVSTGPMSNAVRQRELRKRRKEQQLKPVMLTEVERQWLERLREQGGGAPIQGGNGDFATLEVTDASLLSVWERLPTDFSRAATALGLLRLRNSQHAELVCAVKVLQDRLRASGLDDRVNSRKEQWYWNKLPHRDFRVTSAPEYMERMAAAPTQADDLREARRYLADAQAEIERLHGEKVRSFEANRRLIKRLKAAGLSVDYGPQPDE